VGVTADEDDEAVEVPAELVAVAVKVYAVPFVRPVTAHEPEAPVTVQVAPPGDAVTWYEVGVPPEPADTVTAARPSPATAVGAPGVPGSGGTGVTALEAADELVVPKELAAVAVNVYAVPLVKPVTVHEPKAPVPVQVAPPGLAVTV
jgi:hypothetical protein